MNKDTFQWCLKSHIIYSSFFLSTIEVTNNIHTHTYTTVSCVVVEHACSSLKTYTDEFSQIQLCLSYHLHGL